MDLFFVPNRIQNQTIETHIFDFGLEIDIKKSLRLSTTEDNRRLNLYKLRSFFKIIEKAGTIIGVWKLYLT